ncbi:MAG: hypothetical protein WD645_05875 [Dehalococcoidia bacterium]
MVHRASNGNGNGNGNGRGGASSTAYETVESVMNAPEHTTEYGMDTRPVPKPQWHHEFPAEHDLYDLEVVLPGPTMQGDVLGLDYLDNHTADKLYAYAVVSVFSARVGSAASQSFFRTGPGKPMEDDPQRKGKAWKKLAIEDQDIVEYLDRYLFQEYADSHNPVELDPFILLSYPTDVSGLKLADALVTREEPYQLKSVKGARKLATRWNACHPQLLQAQQTFDRFQKPVTNPFLWAASIAGIGGLLMAALLAVTGNIFAAGGIAGISVLAPAYMAVRAFGYLTRGLASRDRLTKAILTALQEELDTGFPQSDNDVSLYPGFAVKLNLTREHAMFRALIEQEDILSDGVNSTAVHQVFAMGRRILNRLAGRGAVTSGLIMLVSAEANLNVVVPRVVADTVSTVPQYHYNDPSYKGSIFGIVMRPWLLEELPFMERYEEATARCTDARWARRNPLPEHGAVVKPDTSLRQAS